MKHLFLPGSCILRFNLVALLLVSSPAWTGADRAIYRFLIPFFPFSFSISWKSFYVHHIPLAVGSPSFFPLWTSRNTLGILSRRIAFDFRSFFMARSSFSGID